MGQCCSGGTDGAPPKGRGGGAGSSSRRPSLHAALGRPPRPLAQSSGASGHSEPGPSHTVSLSQVEADLAQLSSGDAEALVAACDRLKSLWRVDVQQPVEEVRAALRTLLRAAAGHTGSTHVLEQIASVVRVLCLGQSLAKGTVDVATDSDDDDSQASGQAGPRAPHRPRALDEASGAETMRRYVRSMVSGTTAAELAELCVDEGVVRILTGALKERRHVQSAPFANEALRAISVMARAYEGVPDDSHPRRQSAMVEEEAIVATVRALSTNVRHETVQAVGANALFYITEPTRGASGMLLELSRRRKEHALEAGCVGELRTAASSHAASESVQVAVLRTLNALAPAEAAEAAHAAVGDALQEVVAAMAKFTWHRRIQLYACRILVHVCAGEAPAADGQAGGTKWCVDGAARAGALQCCVKALKSHSTSPSVLLNALHALHVLCRGTDSHAASRKHCVYELDGLPNIVDAMDCAGGGPRDALLLQHGCAAIAAICSGTSSKALVRKEAAGQCGAVGAVMQALHSSGDDVAVGREGCRAFVQLCYAGSGDRVEGNERKAAVAEAGGLELVLEVMEMHAMDHEVQEQGCLALVQLSHGTDAEGLERKQQAAEAGAISAVLAALEKFGGVERNLDAGCLALSTICTGSDTDGLERKQMAVGLGALELVVQHIDAAHAPRTLERGCGLLRNLCTGQDANGMARKQRARDAGALKAVEEAVKAHPNASSLQDAAMGAVRNIKGLAPLGRTGGGHGDEGRSSPRGPGNGAAAGAPGPAPTSGVLTLASSPRMLSLEMHDSPRSRTGASSRGASSHGGDDDDDDDDNSFIQAFIESSAEPPRRPQPPAASDLASVSLPKAAAKAASARRRWGRSSSKASSRGGSRAGSGPASRAGSTPGSRASSVPPSEMGTSPAASRKNSFNRARGGALSSTAGSLPVSGAASAVDPDEEL